MKKYSIPVNDIPDRIFGRGGVVNIIDQNIIDPRVIAVYLCYY